MRAGIDRAMGVGMARRRNPTVEHSGLHERTVLVADEDPGLARSLQILLEDEGRCIVEVARSTDAVLARLDAHADVALVVGDLDLPSERGLRLCDVLRERGAGIPLLLMTAHPSAKASERAVAEGASCLLTKPIDPDELLDRVHELLAEGARSTLQWRQQ